MIAAGLPLLLSHLDFFLCLVYLQYLMMLENGKDTYQDANNTKVYR